MKHNNRSIVSDMKRAKGLGSSHHGHKHWMAQRITAIANIPLVLWAVYSVFNLQGATYLEFTAWLSMPVNAVLAILFVLNTFYHAMLGNQVVIEDYISCICFRTIKLIGQKLFFIALGVATIFAILKIAFTMGL